VSRYLIRKRLIRAAVLWEADPGAFGFWKAALHDTERLQRRIESAEVSMAEFNRCREFLFSIESRPKDILEVGYAFLFLNRTSYSGIVGAGPIGGRGQSSAYSIDCRFNKRELVRQIGELGRLRNCIKIRFGDGITAIQSSTDNDFMYVDPPYFKNGKKFYRKSFCTFDHYRLRKALISATGYWLLSYDYDRKVDYLYRHNPTSHVDLYHSARGAGSKQEILISPLGFAGTSIAKPLALSG
jgi:DNA adenine methylase